MTAGCKKQLYTHDLPAQFKPMSVKRFIMALGGVLVLVGLLFHCATARPDPVRPADNAAVVNELRSHTSRLTVEIAEANLHTDLDFFPPVRALYYRVKHEGKPVVEWSRLGIVSGLHDFTANLKIGKVTASSMRHEYRLLHGKQSAISKEAERFLIGIQNAQAQSMTLEFVLQADAVAFRYLLPKVADAVVTRVNDELTAFRLPPETTGYLQQYQEASKVSPAYEYYFEKVKAGASDSGKASIRHIWQPFVGFTGLVIFGSDGWAFPALFHTPDNLYALITEAGALENYAAVHLTANPEHNVYAVRWPAAKEGNGVGEVNPASQLPLVTPYRVIICCDLAKITQSTAVTDLAEPLDRRFGKMPDWVKPGKATWDWLSYVKTGDEARQKQYIDAAHEFGWQYTLIDANWNRWNNGNAGPIIRQLVQYATGRSVGLWLWYNSGGPNNTVTEEPRDLMHERSVRRNEFAKLRQWGIKGVKIDFWQSEKQVAMRQYVETLEDAADFQLMVNFHGSTIPRGLERRFPNLMTQEAVKGAEWYQFPVFPGPGARDNVYYAFTRNAIGPMDYTPLVFEQAFKQQKISYAHSLALAVIFESGVQHFADNADDVQKGFRKLFGLYPFVGQFLRDVPVAWDGTVFLEGLPDTHIVLAREKQGVWYVAGISSSSREIHVRQPFTFGLYGNYRAEFISEENGGDALTYAESELHTGGSQYIDVKLRPRSGFVLRLTPAALNRTRTAESNPDYRKIITQ